MKKYILPILLMTSSIILPMQDQEKRQCPIPSSAAIIKNGHSNMISGCANLLPLFSSTSPKNFSQTATQGAIGVTQISMGLGQVAIGNIVKDISENPREIIGLATIGAMMHTISQYDPKN